VSPRPLGMKHIYTFLYLFLVSGVAVANVTGIAYVTDGDTVKIGDTRVRLHGIDAPEQQQECGKILGRSGRISPTPLQLGGPWCGDGQ